MIVNSRNAILIVAALGASMALAMAGAHAQSSLVTGHSASLQAAAAQSGTQQPAAPPAQAPRPSMAGKKAGEYYKNLQVLKDIDADQLLPSMDFIVASLGVECENCHVDGAREKDDKKAKLTARKMMQMTMDINKNSFDDQRKVTCFSCHRGAEQPVPTPIIPDVAPVRRAANQQEPALPTVDQLLEKYAQAVGGTANLQKINSRVMKGNVLFGDTKSPIDLYAKAPNKRISFSHSSNGDSMTAFDGTNGWLGNTGRPARDMTPTEAASAKIDADFSLALDLKQNFQRLRVLRPEKIGDKEFYVLAGQVQGLPPVRFYFDEQTGLLSRVYRATETALGRMPVQIDYSDYRESDGIKIPFRWTLARMNGRFTIQLDSVQQNVPIDDSKFAKPAAPTQ